MSKFTIMEIKAIQQFTAHRVWTDKKDYPMYTRYAPDNWTNTMGESDEQVYDCTELESSFQSLVVTEPDTRLLAAL